MKPAVTIARGRGRRLQREAAFPVRYSSVPVSTIVFDLDGVLRHFDADRVRRIERASGLTEGALTSVGFEPELLDSVITGRRTRAEWVAEIGARVGHPAAADEWLADRGVVDAAMVRLIGELRATGITVAILTNGTDTIPDELDQLGLDTEFDAVFNSAALGCAKPDRRVFEIVCERLGVDPPAVFFVDDTAANVAGAVAVGMAARHFTGIDQLEADLRSVGVRQ